MNKQRTLVDYVVVRFDSSCEVASVSTYQTVDQTIDLNGEIVFWVRDALLYGNGCTRVVVITAKDLPQLKTSALLDEYVKRGAKFLCPPETEEDRNLIVWLNEYMMCVNTKACIYFWGPGSGASVLVDESNETSGVRLVSDRYRHPTKIFERNGYGKSESCY